MEAKATALHVRLLRDAATASRAGEGDSLSVVAEGSGLFLRIVSNLRRVHSHIATLVYPVLNRTSRSASAALLNRDHVEGQM
jgi:phosphate:Na+ symporter